MFCHLGSHDGEEDSHRVAWWLMARWDVLVVDIYSCDRPWLDKHRELISHR